MKPHLPLCRLGRASGRFARMGAREDGFSLIEAVAAILIVMIFMAASAASLISGYRAIRQTKYFQQGTALGNRAIEAARDVSYDSLAMLNTDLAGDGNIVPTCSPLAGPGSFYDPGGAALDCERIVSAAGNVDIINHIQTVTVEGKVFRIRRYVTWVDNDDQGGPGQDYKRLSVVVEWDDNGTTDSFETSTFVSRARRGLPVPEFELAPAAQTKQVEQGQTATFAHSIENLGIIDTYDIEMPVPAGWGVQFYADAGQIGVYEPGIDQGLTDTNGSGKPDTGSVATDGVTYFLAVVTVPPLPQPNGAFDLPLTATSGVNDEVTGESANRARVGPVGIALYLHHNPSPPVGNTTAQNQIPMNTTTPTATTLFKYSTNYYNPTAPVYPGRYLEDLATTPAVNENTASKMVNWVYQVPTSALFEGDGSIRLWVASVGQRCDRSISLRFYIRRKNNANSNNAGSTTLLSQLEATVPAAGGAPPCAFTQVDVPFTLPSPGTTIPTNDWIELKVVVNSASADHALIAYDTTGYPSRLVMPQVTM